MSLLQALPETQSFYRLSTSNEEPEDEELSAIQCVLERPQRELDAISVQLRQLQAAMKELEDKRCILQGRIRPLRAITSPIRRLPDDILQEIFLLCLPRGHYPTLDPLQAPLVLTHICQRWRYVASNTRRLWSSIHIPLPVFHIPAQSIPLVYAEDERHKLKAKFGIMVASFVSTVETWVGRIGGCGLSFSVFQHDHQNREEDKCLEDVLHILLRRLQQWEKADFSVPLRLMGSLINIQPEDVPSMKSLSICATSRHGLSRTSSGAFPFLMGQHSAPDALPLWRHSRIFEAPQLDCVSLVRVDEPLALMRIDWEKLTTLAIEKQGSWADFGYLERGIVVDVTVLASLLRQCGRLQHARLALTPGAPDPPKNHYTLATPIELPNLISLAFFEDRSCSVSLLNILEVPSLRKLEFQTRRKPEPFDGAASSCSIIPFLRRSGRRIEEFTVDTQFVLPFDRVMCWEMMPALKHLKLAPGTFSSVKYPGDEQRMLPFTNCDLRLMMRAPSDSGRSVPLLPQLESFECTTLSTVSDREVVEFLRERVPLGLCRVRMAYEKDWDEPVSNLEAELRDIQDGIDLVLEKKFRPSFIQHRQGLKAVG